MRRAPGEYLILASLVGSLAFWGYAVLFGTLRFDGDRFIGGAQIVVALGLGGLALWLLIRRRTTGLVLCMVFYGIQILSVTLPSGRKLGFNSLPTIYYRIHGEKDVPTNLNIISLVLFVLSVFLWIAYRQTPKEAVVAQPEAGASDA